MAILTILLAGICSVANFISPYLCHRSRYTDEINIEWKLRNSDIRPHQYLEFQKEIANQFKHRKNETTFPPHWYFTYIYEIWWSSVENFEWNHLKSPGTVFQIFIPTIIHHTERVFFWCISYSSSKDLSGNIYFVWDEWSNKSRMKEKLTSKK